MRVPGAVRFLSAAHATHAVYGSIVVLAVVTGLDEASATAREALVAVLGAAIGVAVAEVYADMIGATIREQRPPTRAEWREMAVDVAFGFGAALVPAAFFLLATVDVLGLGHAFTIAEWSGVAVIWVYVFAAARAARLRLVSSLVWAAGLTVCGVGIVELKLLGGSH